MPPSRRRTRTGRPRRWPWDPCGAGSSGRSTGCCRSATGSSTTTSSSSSAPTSACRARCWSWWRPRPRPPRRIVAPSRCSTSTAGPATSPSSLAEAGFSVLGLGAVRRAGRAGAREAAGPAPGQPRLQPGRPRHGQARFRDASVRPGGEHPLALRARRSARAARAGPYRVLKPGGHAIFVNHTRSGAARARRSRAARARGAAGGAPVSAAVAAARTGCSRRRGGASALTTGARRPSSPTCRRRASRCGRHAGRSSTAPACWCGPRRRPRGRRWGGRLPAPQRRRPPRACWPRRRGRARSIQPAVERLIAVGYGLTYDAIVRGFAPYEALIDEVGCVRGPRGPPGAAGRHARARRVVRDRQRRLAAGPPRLDGGRPRRRRRTWWRWRVGATAAADCHSRSTTRTWRASRCRAAARSTSW